jgi:hypothetical protein
LVIAAATRVGPDTVYRVKLQQMGRSRGITGNLVNLVAAKVAATEASTQRKAPHAAKTVNTDLDSHNDLSGFKQSAKWLQRSHDRRLV